mmetsp:Transcript_95702/g.194503  ORF Transcript_95702/g.194503 Transcript_95702/m.194503 type:complete len:286 (+) Transcript_95702:525-1382(+)
MKEENLFAISISHQFPFVGMAKMVHDDRSRNEEDEDNNTLTRTTSKHKTTAQPTVGLDIVVFEEINPRLYSSDEEFLEVFRDQFTENEWNNGIQNPGFADNPSMRLREFYVRWAMKEAYTKAIGVGMGLEFKSFEIQLRGIDVGDGDNARHGSFLASEPVWNRVKHRNDKDAKPPSPECFQGKIRYSGDTEDECVCFYFLPLAPSPAGATPDAVETAEGCACVCVGPFRGMHVADNDWRNRVTISWTGLERLVRSHESHEEDIPRCAESHLIARACSNIKKVVWG